jgi:hypothetical protein
VLLALLKFTYGLCFCKITSSILFLVVSFS